MKVYIAGPMRGYPEFNYPAFRRAADRFRALGHDVVSPVEINHGPGDDGSKAPEHYVRNDLRELIECNAIALLIGWEHSTGARCEASVAVTLGMAFYNAGTALRMDAPDRIAIICGGYERQVTLPDDHGVAISEAVDAEFERAQAKFPTWPNDPLHALAVIGEEHGELTKAVLEHTYEPHKSSLDDVRCEAIQLAAMSRRFLASLDVYEYRRSEEHSQAAAPSPKAVA